MSALVRSLLVAGGVAAAIAMPAGPAFAAPPEPHPCAGTENTLVACVDINDGTYYSDCVYLGSGSCTPVTVRGPVVTCSGRYGSICYVSND